MQPPSAVEQVQELADRGAAVELTAIGGQCYALVKDIDAPAPPWSSSKFDILIAIPVAYDAAHLDGFYLALPYTFDGGEHPRVQGQIIEHLDRKWRLVSWHYPDGKPWIRGQDSIETHIVHCRGFFLHRGAINGR